MFIVLVYKFLKILYNGNQGKLLKRMIDINLEITGSNKSDINQNFDKIIEIIENSRKDAFKAVNRELINMYWEIGKYVSGKVSINL